MTLDLTPLFHTSIGFEHLSRVFEQVTNKVQNSNYPPYNILKLKETEYRICIALAGFKKKDIEITLEDNILKISSPGVEEIYLTEYLFKGIANRAFERKFQLAENIKIKEAKLYDGLLNIDLIKKPPKAVETLKIEVK